MKRSRDGVETHVLVYYCRCGPMRGEADLEAAFRTKRDALDFLARVHGLETVEQRRLAREMRLKLDPRWHGSAGCSIRELRVSSDEADRLVSGAPWA